MAKPAIREYTDADRQHFAGYIEDRARMRPLECCGGTDCWVEFGPPAITRRKGNVGGAFCLGCGGSPEIAPSADARGKRIRYAR